MISINIGYYGFAVLLAGLVFALARKKEMLKRIVLTLLIPYIFLIFSAAVFSRKASSDMQIIINPFWTIQAVRTGGRGKAWLVKQAVLNVLMLVPIGLLAPALIKEKKFLKTMLWGIGTSLTIEMLQLVFHRGFAELDDIMSNTLGVFIGYGFYSFIRRIRGIIENKASAA